MKTYVLAGPLDVLGDSIIGTLARWTDSGLKVALAAVVLVTIVRKFSLKAGIGALLAMVLALGIYNARDSLSGNVKDQVENPTRGTGAVTVVVGPDSRGVRGGTL
ncbi:hypothetical protein ACIPY6_34335 [Streptomyces sp. NPDC090054]|uniref:hypothetical protein n=1 Tax=Streptomyces sp. NPDC090054 TaxID=3365933 RepID=UPI0038007D56